MIKCGVASSDAKLKDSVKSLIHDVASGDFVDAICDTAGLAIDALLGNYAGNTSEKQLYKTCVGRFGGVKRIDFYLYSYEFTSDSLISITKNVVVCCMIVSSVNPASIDANTLRNVLEMNYPNETTENLQKLFDIVKAAQVKDATK